MLCRKSWILDKLNLDACTSDVSRLGEGVKWSSRESFILGMMFGCRQNIGGV